MHFCSALDQRCRNCRNWTGVTQWGDCQWVIGLVEPKLFQCVSNQGMKFRVPFDPHEVKYYTKYPQFKAIYSGIRKADLPDGMRLHFSKERDVKFNEEGSPQIHTATLMYIQTRGNFGCQYWQEDK